MSIQFQVRYVVLVGLLPVLATQATAILALIEFMIFLFSAYF